MTKIAIFSDIHGNLTALQAFYDDARELGANDYWFLGDVFGPGPDVQSLWEMLFKIKPSIKIRGNWEDFLLKAMQGGELPDSIGSIEDYVTNNLKKPIMTYQNINKWPLHQEVIINGVKIGLSHNLPHSNDGDRLSVRSGGNELADLFRDNRFNLDIAIYAHIHHPTMRYVDLNCLKPNSLDYNYSEADERLILNCGAIGLPFDKPTHLYKERRAEYLLLEIGENGDINPHFRRVAYNISLVFKRANKYQLPFKDKYINSFEI